jgi:hypothetical protein
VALALTVVWRFVLHDTTTTVSVEDAVEEFRGSAASSTSAAAATSAPAGAGDAATLEPGVYVYRTTGDEGVDTLGGTRHVYPPETTITVTRGGCGLVLRWVALAERSEEWDVCRGPSGDMLTSYYEALHVFFGQDDRRYYTCPAGTPALPPKHTYGERTSITCHSGGLTEVTESEVVGLESFTIGGVEREALHLRIAIQLSGDDGTTGHAAAELWIDPATALPLRRIERGETTSPTVIGDVHYDEQYELVLISLDPQR